MAIASTLRRTPLRPKDWVHDRIKRTPSEASAYDRSWEPRLAAQPTLAHPISQACTAAQIYTPRYRQWTDEMNQHFLIHRKQWEWVYILQTLEDRGFLFDGNRGLGFGVGTEPITAIAAKRGSFILATDADFDHAAEGGWTTTNQHAKSLSALNEAKICGDELFAEKAKFRTADMRNVPDDLGTFDFTWSACALEHLGDLQAGFDFIFKSLEYLRPGGLAVHTTEYNVSSNDDTIESGATVLYRRRDLERLVTELKAAGHGIEITFGLGSWEDDRHIEEIPYTNCHLKVRDQGYVITSFGLAITKAK